MRKNALVNDFTYHVYTRSIADYKIFNNLKEYLRIINVIRYYKKEKPDMRFSKFIKLKNENVRNNILNKNHKKKNLVTIIAYCIMPTHIHLVLKQEKNNGISLYMNRILGSYTRYFNTYHARKGPLWESKFKNVIVDSDEYLYHLTSYIHLNPVTANLVKRPEDWPATSYNEYLGKDTDKICELKHIFYFEKSSYKEFVEERIGYQKELAKIKHLLLE
jgi:putative transposase